MLSLRCRTLTGPAGGMSSALCYPFQAQLRRPLLLSEGKLAHRRVISMSAAETEPQQVSRGMNVLGGPLECCCMAPVTGYYRDGFCRTGAGDMGVHTVCAQVTDEFLAFTASRGNDLSTPVPWANFPGLKVGDRWCLCASRWREAALAGVAPPVVLAATHIRSLDHVEMDLLKQHALDLPEGS